MKTTINREEMIQLRELIEDIMEFFCDDNMVSGEVAWTMVECLAVAKVAQIKGQID